MTCSRCGSALAADVEFCGQCGQAAVASTPAPTWRPPTSSFATGTAIPLSSVSPAAQGDAATEVRLSHGEVVKGTFEIANVRKRLGWLEARLIVTDSRVMYQAQSRNFLNRSVIHREVHLDEVNGLGVSTIKGLSPAGFVATSFAALFAVLGFIPILLSLVQGLGYVSVTYLLWSVFWGLVSAVTFFGMRGTRLVFLVYSGDTSNSPIGLASATGFGLVGGFISLMLSPFTKLLEILGVTEAGAASTNASVDETLELYHAVGALILDLQNRGVLADQVS